MLVRWRGLSHSEHWNHTPTARKCGPPHSFIGAPPAAYARVLRRGRCSNLLALKQDGSDVAKGRTKRALLPCATKGSAASCFPPHGLSVASVAACPARPACPDAGRERRGEGS